MYYFSLSDRHWFVLVCFVFYGNSQSNASCGDYLMLGHHAGPGASLDGFASHLHLAATTLRTSQGEAPCSGPGCNQRSSRGFDAFATHELDRSTSLPGLKTETDTPNPREPNRFGFACERVPTLGAKSELFRPPMSIGVTR